MRNLIRRIRDFLIVALGGITREEHKSVCDAREALLREIIKSRLVVCQASGEFNVGYILSGVDA